ncbi:hypothetical protein Ahia01_000210100 [Argonauta hians]
MTSNLISQSRIAQEDLRCKSHEELSRLVQQLLSENKNLMFNHDNRMKDINRRLQVHLMEIRGLKTVNQKLQDDNQELRELCCFLDDERQNGKKLAKDWQKFGRYTASVMQTEVTNYQEKLKELELKQGELIKDNMEMQELCLYMGQEHLLDNDRDDGDGSSNGTTGGSEKIEETNHVEKPNREQAVQNSIPEQALSYIKHLEGLVRKLEDEKNYLFQQLEHQTNDHANSNHPRTFRLPGPVRAQMVTSWSKPLNCVESTVNPPTTMQYSHHQQTQHKQEQQQQQHPIQQQHSMQQQQQHPMQQQQQHPIQQQQHPIHQKQQQHPMQQQQQHSIQQQKHPMQQQQQQQQNQSQHKQYPNYYQQQEKYQQYNQQYLQHHQQQAEQKHQNLVPPTSPVYPTNFSPQPDAVTHAMKVLEVHQQLELPMNHSGNNNNDLGDNEKAIVREMCNVVWRKLESTSPRRQYSNKHSNSLLEPGSERTSQEIPNARPNLSRSMTLHPQASLQPKSSQTAQTNHQKQPNILSYPQQFYSHHSSQSPTPTQIMANSKARYNSNPDMTHSQQSSSRFSPTSAVKPMSLPVTENRTDQRNFYT